MRLTLLSIFSLCFSIVLQAQITNTLNLNAGNLSASLTTEEKNTVSDLILTGTIDPRDFKTMRDDMPFVADIDIISGATIAEYNGTGGTSLFVTTYSIR